MGQSVLATSDEVAFTPIFINMVSTGGLVMGREFRLGALAFIADDSAWLQEAPLDIDALPVRGATHFRACVRGVLLRQPSTPYWSTPAPSSLPVSRQRKYSGRSRLQQWVRDTVARQSATTQSVSALSRSSPTTLPGSRRLHSTSTRSQSVGPHTFVHVSVASCCGNHGPRIGRPLRRPPSLSPASASALVGRDFSDG